MTVGWYQASDALWYYTSEVSDGNLGMLIKGWHKDGQDGKWYFLDRRTGIMLSGWQEIDGKVIICRRRGHSRTDLVLENGTGKMDL